MRIGLNLASLGGSAAAPSTSGFAAAAAGKLAAAAGKPAAEDAADPDTDACWPCHKKEMTMSSGGTILKWTKQLEPE